MTRCAVCATTPRSCVIRISPVPSSFCSSTISAKICAWMVTSSAVVGSSAISSAGRQASAIAIMARWRMPPESWCGYSRARRSGSGMRTRRSISTARAQACFDVMSWCSRTASVIWSPIRITGLSEVIGSWKIIDIRLPRMPRISSSESASRSRPSSTTEPPTILPGGFGTRRMMERALTLLPQPDSPTIASVSPRRTLKETSSTALNSPELVKNTVFRFCTSRIRSSALVPLISRVASDRGCRAARLRTDWCRTRQG
ncbi:hypothetical protein ES707_05704 [subsurface metagenome]